jgi:hypothetical protein
MDGYPKVVVMSSSNKSSSSSKKATITGRKTTLTTAYQATIKSLNTVATATTSSKYIAITSSSIGLFLTSNQAAGVLTSIRPTSTTSAIPASILWLVVASSIRISSSFNIGTTISTSTTTTKSVTDTLACPKASTSVSITLVKLISTTSIPIVNYPDTATSNTAPKTYTPSQTLVYSVFQSLVGTATETSSISMNSVSQLVLNV